MAKDKTSFFQKLLKRYRLSIFERNSFNEVFSMSVSRMKVLISILILAIIVIGSTVSIYYYTPLKKTLPGYPSDSLRAYIINNAIMLDSLKAEIDLRDHYLEKIQDVISGGIPEDDSTDIIPIAEANNFEAHSINQDSIINELLGSNYYNLSLDQPKPLGISLSDITFFTPIKGLVSQKFKGSPGHFGTDIVARANTRVSTILDGTVILANWTLATGYVMVILHEHDIISVYKHNAELLKKQGDKVTAGEAIAIMGNSGELTSGPHLHFELWVNNEPVDAEMYINFQND